MKYYGLVLLLISIIISCIINNKIDSYALMKYDFHKRESENSSAITGLLGDNKRRNKLQSNYIDSLNSIQRSLTIDEPYSGEQRLEIIRLLNKHKIFYSQYSSNYSLWNKLYETIDKIEYNELGDLRIVVEYEAIDSDSAYISTRLFFDVKHYLEICNFYNGDDIVDVTELDNYRYDIAGLSAKIINPATCEEFIIDAKNSR